jgi:hypothetical protein
MRSNLIDIEVILHHETDRAVLVSDDGIRENAVWLPKSACEIEQNPRGSDRQATWTVTLLENLAIAKGLV